MTGRTFVVTVSVAPCRVVVEDVRTGCHSVAASLDTVGGHIARLLAVPRIRATDAASSTTPGAPCTSD